MPTPSHRPRRVLALLAPLVFSLCAVAQTAPPDPDAPNLVHDRHMHPWNEPHGTVAPDGTRFFTNRSSDARLDLPREDDAFFFVVFGDRTGGPDSGVNILADAVRDTNLLEPDLVMTVGDLIDGYNTTDPWLTEMKEYKAIMDRLVCPWFPVAGNHDVYWRGPNPPAEEHEGRYEAHFGPLWYGFKHKSAGFVVLYSDEGNPETGERTFRDPAAQRMSPEQLEFLQETLEWMKDRKHVFVFLHHPRWLGGNYGGDWEKVHKVLADAGNVRAVFAGHIHRMRHDGPRDGIEYVTLATVGGGQSAIAPDAGYLHQFHIVTVRDQQIALSAVPVGGVMDVRDLTGEVSEEVARLARTVPGMSGDITLDADGSGGGTLEVSVENTGSRTIETTVLLDSRDSRWATMPDHHHATIPAGETRTFVFDARRFGASMDEGFRPLEAVVTSDYLTERMRYGVPEQRVEVPLDLDLSESATRARPTPGVLRLDGNDALRIDHHKLRLPEGPFTLEAWFRAGDLGGRRGLVTKTENSEFGLFVSNGVPGFSVHAGGGYKSPGAGEPMLQTGRWHHLAGVFDGSEARLYLDGVLIDTAEGGGELRRNTLPMFIGADVDGRGAATSFFEGEIDTVRLTLRAVYTGERFVPRRDLGREAETVLLIDMDRTLGPWVLETTATGAHATRVGDPEIVAEPER